MKKKSLFAGLLGIMLVFGCVLVACDNGNNSETSHTTYLYSLINNSSYTVYFGIGGEDISLSSGQTDYIRLTEKVNDLDYCGDRTYVTYSFNGSANLVTFRDLN
jgi:hypothetical protein